MRSQKRIGHFYLRRKSVSDAEAARYNRGSATEDGMDIQPLHTKVDKTIQVNAGMIVLENPSGFPRNESNLYLLRSDGTIIWRAEKPDASTFFSRVKLNEDGETFSAYTIHGHACELELKTGKLISFTSIQ